MDLLAIAPGGGFIATLVAMAWLVYTGRLVPRATVDALLARETIRAEVAEANGAQWREAATTNAAQVTELLVAARVTTQVLQALPAAPPETRA